MRCRWALILLVVLCVPIPALRGQSVMDLEQQGGKALEAGQFAAAERIFSQLVALHPSAAAYSDLATAEGAEGKFGQAVAHFRKAIELGDDTPRIHYVLGLAYLKENQSASGIRQLELALGRKPGFAVARYALGLALLDAGQPRKALASLQQVRDQFAKNPWMWTNLARAQFVTGDSHHALQTIDDATQALPADPQLLASLARLCLAHQQPQKARELLENACEMAPGDNGLKLLLAQASLQALEPQEALAVLHNVPPNAGAPGEVAFLQGNALMLSQKGKEAASLLAQAVAADPTNIRYLSTSAELQTLQGNYSGALASLRKAQLAQPNSSELLYEIALVYVRMGRYKTAVATCQQAARLAPKFDQPYFLQGVIQFGQGDSAAAVDAFRQAAGIVPDSPLYHAALGAALLKSGKLSESEKELDRALALDPRTVSAYLWRARWFENQKQPAKAIADLQTFVALDANYPQAYEELAWLYSAKGQTTKASAAQCQYHKLLAKSKPSGQTPFFLTQLGTTVIRQAHSRDQ
jgi:tetratricopeptide (TPR) repeat protein